MPCGVQADGALEGGGGGLAGVRVRVRVRVRVSSP